MYKLTCNAEFTAVYTSEICDCLEIIHLSANAVDKPHKLELTFEWRTDNIGINVCYSPMGYTKRHISPEWAGYVHSNAMSSAPVLSDMAYNDINRMTIACSDAKNSVRLRSGVVEESAEIITTIIINVDCNVEEYSADIRIDTREIPFYKCIEDVSKWWETYDGYQPVRVPDEARYPLYSAWYSFHQETDIPRIIDECCYFSDLGCKSIIVDDGWQTDNNNRGYSFCGDWNPTPSKIPDMKDFVEAVHQTGMKFILWYSVPFVGIHSKAYQRFKDKKLADMGDTYALDPRYPEVMDYLIGIYKSAVIDWNLDGFKLDFIDSFHQSTVFRQGMDFVSVYDAVDRLMKDIMSELTLVKPDILIEFRQSYMGPLMRTFGNMIRSGDCPNDSFSNRLNTLSLRMTSGNTSVHSDMLMWNYSEPVEKAAFQITNVLFSVPQISVLHDRMPPDHAEMLKHYLNFWIKYRTVLLDGEMMYKNYSADYTYVSSRKDNSQVGVVYTGRFAYIEKPTDEIVLINASFDNEIIPSFSTECNNLYYYTVTDCLGKNVDNGNCVPGGNFIRIKVPINGIVILRRSLM